MSILRLKKCAIIAVNTIMSIWLIRAILFFVKIEHGKSILSDHIEDVKALIYILDTFEYIALFSLAYILVLLYILINVFKGKVSRKFGDFRIHCMMDEIGKLHPQNVKGILDFANARNILLINSSPTTYNVSDYRYTYLLSKDSKSQSSDLRTWLQTIPNQYVHFGDFDLAGIHIFLTEFQKHLGTRASFLIPQDIELRIKHGSAERYNDQYQKFCHLTSNIPPL